MMRGHLLQIMNAVTGERRYRNINMQGVVQHKGNAIRPPLMGPHAARRWLTTLKMSLFCSLSSTPEGFNPFKCASLLYLEKGDWIEIGMDPHYHDKCYEQGGCWIDLFYILFAVRLG